MSEKLHIFIVYYDSLQSMQSWGLNSGLVHARQAHCHLTISQTLNYLAQVGLELAIPLP